MSLFLALVMLVGVALPSVAMAEETAKQDTHSVTLHKILTAQHNLAARRVTINKGQDSEETKVIIKKEVAKEGGGAEAKYYEQGKMDNALAADNAFVKEYANGEPVFEGKIGINGKEYTGTSIGNAADIAGFFGQDAKEIPNVILLGKKRLAQNGNILMLKAKKLIQQQ